MKTTTNNDDTTVRKPIAACINWEWVHSYHTRENGKLDFVKDEAFLLRIWDHAVKNGYRGTITRGGLERICNRNLY